MDVIRGHQRAPAWPGAAVAIGNFDGVHLGHRALAGRARSLAEAHDARSVVLTFDPHPSRLISPSTAPPALTSLERRLELLAETGIDAVVVEPFTRELAACPPQRFVDDVVLFGLRARAIVVGYDFSYGQGRAGTVEALRVHGQRAGIEVDILPAVSIGRPEDVSPDGDPPRSLSGGRRFAPPGVESGEIASSTRIRQYLREGNLAGAERLLGRRWDVDGTVVHGAKRGRTIGIPTANVSPASDLPIAPGIYAVTLAVADGPREAFGPPRPAVASLGTNPTFVDRGGLVLEVHLLDFDGDLYDRRVRTTFVARLRDELKFDSVDALVAQIHLDIAAARTHLG